jgi:hypothetical protein
LVVSLSPKLWAAVHHSDREPPTPISQDGPTLNVRDQRLLRYRVALPETVEVAVQKNAIGHIPLIGTDEEIRFPGPLGGRWGPPQERRLLIAC